MIFFESRSDELSDVGELSPTVLLEAAPTYSAPDARTSGVFGFPALHISKAPSGLSPRGSVASSMHHFRLPLVLSSHCSRLFTRTTRPETQPDRGLGKTREHTTTFQTVGKGKECPWRAAQGARSPLDICPSRTCAPFCWTHSRIRCKNGP